MTRRWLKGNTHTHTNNSDGNSSPDTVVRWYREHGYQFLFVTDHEFNTDVAPLLNLQWRRRFADGTIVARGGYTYERSFGDFDLDGDGDAESNVKYGDRTSRSYFLGHGMAPLKQPNIKVVPRR